MSWPRHSFHIVTETLNSKPKRYHCAAKVSSVHPVDVLLNANVCGTARMYALALAAARHGGGGGGGTRSKSNVDFNHVSTLGFLPAGERNPSYGQSHGTPPPHPTPHTHTYVRKHTHTPEHSPGHAETFDMSVEDTVAVELKSGYAQSKYVQSTTSTIRLWITLPYVIDSDTRLSKVLWTNRSPSLCVALTNARSSDSN